MHVDVNAMIKAADAVRGLAEHLGVPAPRPHLYGLSYCQFASLGGTIINGPELKEPAAKPCLKSPSDIDHLREPDDYLACPIVQQRLELARQLKTRRPDASTHIGHDLEGPVTTAALLLGGETFFMLPYDDPKRAHKLLDFCVKTSVNYCRALRKLQGRPFGGQSEGMPDDFGGMFSPEFFGTFVAAYWEKLYSGLGASQRFLHSELLRPEHLRWLADLKINEYDSGVDQYLPPEKVSASCPVPFTLRIWPSMVMSQSSDELVVFYRHLVSFRPTSITFHLEHMEDLPKIEALLKVARDLGES
jgi:hypothetical protein